MTSNFCHSHFGRFSFGPDQALLRIPCFKIDLAYSVQLCAQYIEIFKMSLICFRHYKKCVQVDAEKIEKSTDTDDLQTTLVKAETSDIKPTVTGVKRNTRARKKPKKIEPIPDIKGWACLAIDIGHTLCMYIGHIS